MRAWDRRLICKKMARRDRYDLVMDEWFEQQEHSVESKPDYSELENSLNDLVMKLDEHIENRFIKSDRI